ncbi:MAG: hypothetical protein ACLPPF_08085 [Rhodomicrobium sp.]
MSSSQTLHVRLHLKEALAQINEARSAAADAWTASRLKLIVLDLEDALTSLAPERGELCSMRRRSR